MENLITDNKTDTLDLEYIKSLSTTKIPFSIDYEDDKLVITVDDEFKIESQSILYSVEKNQLIKNIINFIESNYRIFKLSSLNGSLEPVLNRLSTDELKSLYDFTEWMTLCHKFRKFVKYIDIQRDNKRTDNSERNNLIFKFFITKQFKKIDYYENLFNIFLDELNRIKSKYDIKAECDNSTLNFLRFEMNLEK